MTIIVLLYVRGTVSGVFIARLPLTNTPYPPPPRTHDRVEKPRRDAGPFGRPRQEVRVPDYPGGCRRRRVSRAVYMNGKTAVVAEISETDKKNIYIYIYT